MSFKTITEIKKDLSDSKISSVELTQDYFKRIKQHHSKINAFVTLDEEQALMRAKSADQLIASREHLPLTGIPIAHKDIFCTKGLKTSCASKMLDNFTAPYDATVVKKLKEHHTVLLGKTNMDEFAMGSSNENSHYGNVANPWNLECSPGGSSGGSAAAVAAGFVPAATGTDTGGSIRQPAAFCGVTGIKPTYGRVSRYGMVAFASSLDQGGPLTRTAEDAALMLNAMEGFDPHDSTSAKHETTDYQATLNDSLEGLRVGIPKQYFTDGLDPKLAKIIQTAINEYEKLGCKLVDIEMPHHDFGIAAYYIIAPAEASSNLSRYDGIRYGYRCEDPKDLTDLYQRTRSEGFGDEVKRRIMVGTYVLSSGYYDAYYLKAQKIRRLIKNDFMDAFEKVDMILAPTTPTTAFTLNENSKDPISMYHNDICTITANLSGIPAMSIPCGFLDGMPCGLQLLGNYFSEGRLLNAAHQYQQVTDWHLQHPEELS